MPLQPSGSKPPPKFDRSLLVDLSSHAVYERGRRLYESGAAEALEWTSPVLSGRVKDGATEYAVRLNLRSTTFAANECGCAEGRRGQVCAHAVAVCLAFEAGRGEDRAPVPEPGARPAASVRPPPARNRRRAAEAGAWRAWEPGAGDHPAADGAASREAFSGTAVQVDGSPNFLAVRLPVERNESILQLRELLKAEGFSLEPRNGRWWLRDRHRTLNFLAAHWRALRNEWRAEFTDNFEEKFKAVTLAEPEVEVTGEGGRFAVELRLGAGADEESLRRALGGGRSYAESGNGSITLIDRKAAERLHAAERALSGQADRPFTPVFRRVVENAELAGAEEMLEELSEGWRAPAEWRVRSRALREVAALEPAPVRAEFDELLRGYQRIGVAWLWHLYRNQLGGILADEMGLGKTLQALALIECVRGKAGRGQPALVVAPASLVENWAREAARFVPGLRVIRQQGPARATEPAPLEDADLVVTSYGTLRQDADLLATLDWSVVVGDEAQHIKNRHTRNARALTRLRSPGRFLLTGTPVENSLDDLVSLFAFLMPGYLGNEPAKAGAEEREWRRGEQLRRAAPYVLRRTKREVAPELPEKIERTLFCELGETQRRFYGEVLEKTRRELQRLEGEGARAGRLRLAALTELLRLRQACVDPRILDDGFAAEDCGKLAAFEEILDECLDVGSRILLFSSFVSALRLLAARLEERGTPYCYLDGSTRDRMAVCDRFNHDESIPVFLISLKAGGSGLNLTGADTVVHYDPWWNPAAEAQATDRAHRIGQTRTVTSIRIIAADTVEEKVLELQRRKAEVLRELFEESAAATAEVSLEDVRALLG